MEYEFFVAMRSAVAEVTARVIARAAKDGRVDVGHVDALSDALAWNCRQAFAHHRMRRQLAAAIREALTRSPEEAEARAPRSLEDIVAALEKATTPKRPAA